MYPSNHYTKGGILLVTEFFLTNALTSFHLGELSLTCCQDNKSGDLATKLYSQINSYDVTSHVRGPPLPSTISNKSNCLSVCDCQCVQHVEVWALLAIQVEINTTSPLFLLTQQSLSEKSILLVFILNHAQNAPSQV